jgi:hypothetical protein
MYCKDGHHSLECEGRNRYPDIPLPDVIPEVPKKFEGARFEYIDGYRHGLKAPGCWCPVQHLGEDNEHREKAWKAGREAGSKVRESGGGLKV